MNSILRQFPFQDLWKPSTFAGAVTYALFFFAIATAFAFLVRRTTSKLARGNHHYWKDETAIFFLAQLARVAVYVICFILYVHLIPLLHPMAGALLSGASVLTLILGLGSQNILGNVAAGISVLLYRPFSLGDTVTVGTPNGFETGHVETISLSHTILRMADGRRINVPNCVLVSQTTIVDDRPADRIKPAAETVREVLKKEIV